MTATTPGEVRRPMTVVFVDVVGSTPLSIVMDDEDYTRLIADYRAIANRVVAAHDGFVPKDEGDGRFVWFGWPTARRDDAERAVAMSHDLMQAVAALSAEVEAATGLGFALRIGIHTGPVVVTFPKRPDSPDVNDATVNFAAKVQQAADSGTILISESTAAVLTTPHELKPRDPVSVGDLPGGINVFAVVGVPAGDRVGRPAGHSSDDTFVGRRAQLDQLLGRWREVVDGGSAAVTITGSSGMGKTRLVTEFVRRSAIEEVVHLQGDVDRSGSPFHRLVPAVAELAERLPGIGPAWEPSTDRADDIRHLIRFFRSCTEHAPVLLSVDDGQWLDPSTVEALGELNRARVPRLMILLTARLPLPEPVWGDLDQLPLPPLTSHECSELVGAGTAAIGDDPRELDELIERSAGNPFFLRWMSRAGAQQSYQGVRRLLRPRSGVPAVVQQAVRSQIDGAGVDDDVTSTASVIGMEFTADLLGVVLDATPEELDSSLRALAEHDIVRSLPGTPGRFRFTHGLVKDLAYDLLLEGPRREKHALVADTLVDLGTDDNAQLGLHHDRAGRPLEACEAKLTAARSYRHTGAYREAASLVERVVELAESHGDAIPRELHLEAAELNATLAAAVSPDSYRAAAAQGSAVVGLLTPGDEVRRSVMAKTRDWAGAVMAGDLRSSARLLYEVRQTAKTDFPEIMACNQNARGLHAALRGRYALAERLLVASLETMQARGIDPWLEENWATPDDPIALAFSYSPPVLAQRGRIALADNYVESAWRRAEIIPGGAHTIAHVGAQVAIHHELLGNGEEALRLGEEVTEIGRELGLVVWEMEGQIHERRGNALLDPTPGLADQLDADGATLDAFAPIRAGLAHLLAASTWARLGDDDRMAKSLDALRQSSATTGMNHLDAEEQRLRASLLDGSDRIDTLLAAVATAARQGALRYRLRALCDLAEVDPAARVGEQSVVEAIVEASRPFTAIDDDADGVRARAVASLVDV